MKILTVVGARPNFIKLAPLSKELRKHHKEIIVHTGQHYDIEMSGIFFEQLNIPKPDYALEVGSSSHAEQVGKIILRIEKVMLKEKPELVLVYGDTNSELGGALCASKLNMKIAHVEAGMRSYDKMPEEINRVVTDHVSDIFFCSTETAVKNLKKEGITKNVFLVGDLMIDALMQNIKIAEETSDMLNKLGIEKKKYMLATIHRAENTDDKLKLKSIIDSLIASNEKIIFPLHPRTKKCLKAYSLFEKLKNSNVVIIEPLPYLDMIVLEKNAKKIITDSGGMQKEAYFFKVPCITLRNATEWVETVENGWNVLVGADARAIANAINEFAPKGRQKNYFGNGDSSKKIIEIINKL